MDRVLIVTPSEDLRISLAETLQSDYQVSICSDGFTALDILAESKPEVLILDLELPGIDGISVLEKAGKQLPVITITLGTSPSNYVFQLVHDLGAAILILKPCNIRAIVKHIQRLAGISPRKHRIFDPQLTTSRYLMELSIPPNLDGFKQLKAGIPLYAQDSTQRITKELFPKIAMLFGCSNPNQVERSIRSAIHYGWENGDPKKWAKLFPPDSNGNMKCPTTKEFIACLAERLQEIWP